jgi:hypothetical protein
MIRRKHKHAKKMKIKGQTHPQKLLTKSAEVTAGTTKCIKRRKSKAAEQKQGTQIQLR